ncbi:MAG: ACT domain-containing protein [Acidobacteria bacterium]|nr:ACT domain-containing protein [Acidobacteriota bacterium]
MERVGGADALWAHTRLHVWPERYVLLSFPTDRFVTASELVTACVGTFAAMLLERDEVSLTIPEAVWKASSGAVPARAEAGPFRAITFDLDIDLNVCGYLAPAAVRLAEAGVSIVPQCAYLKDHLLVHERDLPKAIEVLTGLISGKHEASA